MSAPDLTPEQMAAIDIMADHLSEGTHYGLLHLPTDASKDDIQKAYYRLSRQWHPDRFFRKDIGEYADRLEMVFVAITQAYQTLRDDNKRKAYDRTLRESGKLERQRPAPPPAAAPAPEAEPQEEGDAPPSGSGASLKDRLAARRKTTKRAPRSRVRSRVEAKVREQLRSNLAKAQVFYEQGKLDYEAGRIVKAAGALELAVEFDPRNDEYRELYDVAKREARKVRINQLVLQGEQAESYQQYRQAIHVYRDAVELGPSDGKVYFRLARLVRHEEANDREALSLLREAVVHDPDVLEYRMALGDLFRELGLKRNARREYQEVLSREKRHPEAKAALKEL